MISLRQLAGGVAVAAIATTIAGQAMAQETTADIRGTVVDASGNPVSGANVTILHVPTGTVVTKTTGGSGTFSGSGLRVGGPYSVIVTAPGMAAYRQDGIVTQLGSPFRMTAQLAPQTEDEIVITATRGGFQNTAIGPGSSYSAADIASTASISRDLKDVLEKDPRVFIDRSFGDGFSVVGTNNRFNSFSVDGVGQNDDFGLNANGYPTQRSPVSIDIVEAVNLEIAPFDVEYGGFTGAAINAVTKSGTNEFHGGAQFLFSSDELSGDKIDGSKVNVSNFKDKTYEGHLSGPIVKDKIFFIGSYEQFDTSDPINTTLPSTVTQADLDQISSISKSVYGFDPLGIPSSLPTSDKKYFAKVDWNVNENHRLVFAYQRTGGSNIRVNNFRRNDVSFSSNWYRVSNTLKSYKAEWFANWSDKLSTEVKVANKTVNNGQIPLNGTGFAQFEIATPGGGSVFLGPDRFRQANRLSTHTFNVKAKADYQTGNHLITVGGEKQRLEVFNLFVQRATGLYTFDSITDFQNRVASSLDYGNAPSGISEDAAAHFDFSRYSAYIQDEWQVTDSLQVTGGFRYDVFDSHDNPSLNQNFVERHGFANTATLNGRDLIQPRIGFSWTYDDRTKVSGGAGLFTGGNPNVWISNSFTNDGIKINRFNPSLLAGLDNNTNGIPDYLENVDGFNVNPAVIGSFVPGNGDVNATDPGFDLPSTWRYNLNVTHNFDLGRFGDDYRVKADFTYSEVNQAINYIDLRSVQVGTAPDGRPLLGDKPDATSGAGARSSGTRDFLLTNTKKGHGKTFSVSVDKAYENGFSFLAGYAYTKATDVNPGTSSTASSNYGNFSVANLLNTPAARSNYSIKHNFTFDFSYHKAFFGDYETGFNLTGLVRSGRPFSYNFKSGINPFGDSQQVKEDRQLLYVPAGPGATDDPNVVYAPGFDLAAFNAFISSAGLEKYRGKIVPRNAKTSPWWNTWDVRFTQEIPGLRKTHRTILSLDIENVGNLIKSKWGTLREVGFEYNNPVVETDIIGGQYSFTKFSNPFAPRTVRGASLWQIQLGIKYEF